MRILVDIPEGQIRAIEEIGRTRKQSRARVIRDAIDDYLQDGPKKADFDLAFGSWGAGEDGVVYQQRLRADW